MILKIIASIYFHSIPLECRCNKEGTNGNSNVCQKNATNGACSIKPGCNPPFTGRHCYSCEIGYYKVGNSCQPCGCDINGKKSNGCDFNGKCDCKIGYSGDKCDSSKAVFISHVDR